MRLSLEIVTVGAATNKEISLIFKNQTVTLVDNFQSVIDSIPIFAIAESSSDK